MAWGLFIGFILGVAAALVGVDMVLRWARRTGRLHSPTPDFTVFCKVPYKKDGFIFGVVDPGRQTHATTEVRQ